jgi:hypothetical protein
MMRARLELQAADIAGKTFSKGFQPSAALAESARSNDVFLFVGLSPDLVPGLVLAGRALHSLPGFAWSLVSDAACVPGIPFVTT